MQRIVAESTASISALKVNPMQVLAAAEGETVAILNRNKPAFYCVPPERYEQMLEMIEDAELAQLVHAREGQREIKVSLHDL